MLSFGLRLEIPSKYPRWDIKLNKSKKMSNGRSLDFNLYRSNAIVVGEIDIHVNGDHPGFRMMVGVLTWEVEVEYYSNSHQE